VLIARDGNQGLAMAEREDPDLVILDMMMPKRSGFLVLEKMRRTRETPLRVNNQSWLDMRIYVVASGQRVRLGMVNANNTAVLRIPAYVVGLGREVSFLADPQASGSVARSFSMYIQPGEEVSITIPPTVR
jgi:CheY-like chemotaxis protein